jgi:hypothetical protein
MTDRRDCIYPDCQIKGEWLGTACEHSCEYEREMKGCTCRMSVVHSIDIDPPEPIIDKWCPVHGRDPDQAYEEWRERQYEKTPPYMEDDQ